MAPSCLTGRGARAVDPRSGARHGFEGGDPLRPAAPRLRSPRFWWWRPAAPGCAALAMATGWAWSCRYA